MIHYEEVDKTEMCIEQECPGNQEIYRRFVHGLPLGVKSYPWGKAESFAEARPIICDFTDIEKATKYVKSINDKVTDLQKRLQKAKEDAEKEKKISPEPQQAPA